VRGGVGIPELFIIGTFLLPALLFVAVGVAFFAVHLRRRAQRQGYPTVMSYLRASPHSDAQKRDAADLTMQGVVLCVLGAVFAPFVLVGLVPLFYGGRKLAYALLGFGLVDDAEPGA
jgi:hypothetical protein